MLLRVYVQPRDEFDRWIQEQQQQPRSRIDVVSEGRQVFETTACINCHTVSGTRGQRPLRSRSDAPDEPRHDRLWRRATTRPRICGSGFENPDAIKPGSHGCRPWGSVSSELDAVAAYLETLR